MIINIRGTSGSGKTTLMRKIMDKFQFEPLDTTDRGKVLSYKANTEFGPMVVLGSYESVCGGCDTITDTEVSRAMIRKYGKRCHVLFEGLVMNNAYAGNLEIMRKLKVPFAFAFLDTPLRTCISRVRKRRKERGNIKPLDTTNTEKMYYSNLRMMERALGDDANPVSLDHKDPLPKVLSMLKENKL